MEEVQILIIEDDVIGAAFLKNALEDKGYNIAGIVDTGIKAIDFTGREKLNLIISDIRINGDMDGIEAVAKIKEHHDIPVIFITAFIDSLTRERAELTKPFGYLVKPFDLNKLYSVVESAINTSQQYDLSENRISIKPDRIKKERRINL